MVIIIIVKTTGRWLACATSPTCILFLPSATPKPNEKRENRAEEVNVIMLGRESKKKKRFVTFQTSHLIRSVHHCCVIKPVDSIIIIIVIVLSCEYTRALNPLTRACYTLIVTYSCVLISVSWESAWNGQRVQKIFTGDILIFRGKPTKGTCFLHAFYPNYSRGHLKKPFFDWMTVVAINEIFQYFHKRRSDCYFYGVNNNSL